MRARQIVLDTETTGLDPAQGHRIIEIGCVELVNRRHTERRFHTYLQPDRLIDAEAVRVHGITNQRLTDEPRFPEIVEALLDFVRDAELIIHNAPFDLGFLNHELRLCGRGQIVLERLCAVEDTLLLARQRHPGQRNSLDALCKRYNIDNSQRTLHGALLDAEILADLYLAMTRQQSSMFERDSGNAPALAPGGEVRETRALRNRPALAVLRADAEEAAAHARYLELLEKSSGGQCVWKRLEAS
ncbi:MAG: DNA polymerase III subunit epsilon [Candidatus Competibacteraceae bacterium]|nr:DNA polymerase III subunit epsilon [Candidatus Competibacteraceae bacterium]MBK7983378.1 DNA polymerase III subunit epsilon [Candidatus Competibacteraceae bacterium]MBK8898075.1 DNA polymerase III subunit epsilon [Candidatus Competibacteraceae bacterium]MBK8961882.1 DNA polymerase III subunit epsilon [Candidatus Competibacteraceae bacterium]MBK9951099.1 DNA polymerase III subunit epsilon [Candidatus Competibacteraceae bacterium]